MAVDSQDNEYNKGEKVSERLQYINLTKPYRIVLRIYTHTSLENVIQEIEISLDNNRCSISLY
jgi:hypothetical protein